MRVGQGVDVHAFADDPTARPLVLGGVTIDGGPALAGHSDADVALHAVTDALLGAGGLGDLGERFGTDRPEWAGAASGALVTAAVGWLADAGWRPANVDCTIVAQRPRLAAHRGAMRAALADLLGVEVAAASVKATTTDGLGLSGRGEGIACLAVALVERA